MIFNKLEELSSNLPFPLSAAIIMHLQKKKKYFCWKMNSFLWWVLHGSVEPTVWKIPKGANIDVQKSYQS